MLGVGHHLWVVESDEPADRERRQFLLMEDRLRAFDAGDIYIAKAINDLEGLVSTLELTPDDWVEQFREAWGDLEVSYAVALDRLEPIPDATDPVVREAVAEMRRLVAERLAASP
jgi:hypothetical protein